MGCCARFKDILPPQGMSENLDNLQGHPYLLYVSAARWVIHLSLRLSQTIGKCALPCTTMLDASRVPIAMLNKDTREREGKYNGSRCNLVGCTVRCLNATMFWVKQKNYLFSVVCPCPANFHILLRSPGTGS